MKDGFMRSRSEFSMLETDCIYTKQNKIGLLGGTFNPIHNGHISMAYIVLYEFLLGKVIFLPSGNPPHKTDEYIAPAEVRLDMIRLAIENEPRFDVSRTEINRGGMTYTVDTLSMLARTNNDAQYYYIIGADTLFELPTWRDFERVIRLTRFLCVMRPGQNDIRVRQYADSLNSRYGHRIYIADERGPDISSSHIRALAESGCACTDLVPVNVAQYITQNRVYFKEV